MPRSLAGLALLVLPAALLAQAAGHFPPDSLVNVKVFLRTMPVIQVIGQMRNFTGDLGVRCQFCHVGQEGQPLEQFDFVSDSKRTKMVARQMMLMVQEINRRVDTLPGHGPSSLQVTCATCHHGVSRPAPLATVLTEVGTASGPDSAVRVQGTPESILRTRRLRLRGGILEHRGISTWPREQVRRSVRAAATQ